MIEILVLIKLTRNIGDIVENKGYKRTWYKLMTVLFWFSGELLGAVVGVLVSGHTEARTAIVYLLAILGAILGAVLAFVIANRLPAQPDAYQSAVVLHPKEGADTPSGRY